MKKEPEDRNKLKIASFRTTDGDWFDFSQVAESNGLTATDVLKACMVEYQAGTYTPVINTPVSMRIQAAQGITAEKVQELISTAINTVPVNEDLRHWDELRAEVNQLRERLDNAASKEYVALIDKGLSNRLNDLWADLERLKTTVKVSAAPPSKPQPATIRTASEPTDVVRRVMNRLEAEPRLKARISEGLANGLAGAALGEWLGSGGFWNKSGNAYEGASLSQFKAAIEHLHGLKNGA
jgi:hypothetical protein